MEQIEVQNMESVMCSMFLLKYVRNKICILGIFIYA